MRIAVLLLLLISQAAAQNPRTPDAPANPKWRYVATTDDDRTDFETYYDAAHLDRQESGIMRVWLKQVPITKTETERQRLVDGIIQNRKLNKMDVNGYDRYAYSLTLIEVDCSRSRARSYALRDYDDADKLLGSDTKEDLPFAPLRKESMAYLILKAACK